MGREILLILDQFGAGGGGDAANNAVRFLLAAFFWAGLGLASLQQYRGRRERRDLYVLAAAAFGFVRELLMFALEYGAWRGWVPQVVSYRVFPPLEHTLTDVGRALLGFAYLLYFGERPRTARRFLRLSVAAFALLFLVTTPLWNRFLDARAALFTESTARFGLFWGDLAYRLVASAMLGTVLLRLLLLRARGRTVAPSLFAGFLFLFADEFLMIFNLATGDGPLRTVLGPIRHNLGMWAIPLFLWAYWDEIVRQLREERERSRTSEAAAWESEERYRTLAENIDLGITLMDGAHRVRMANPAHGRLLRRDTGACLGVECYRAFHGRDSICPDCPGVTAMTSGKPAIVEKSAVRPDGGSFSVRIHAFPVRDAAGVVQGFIEVVEETTAARAAAAERTRLEARVMQAQKLESLGILAGGIAHDFNNLLMGILGNTDLALAKTAPESPARPFIQAVDRAAQRAADLTNQMLAYSGKGRFVVEPVSLTRIVEEMGHLLATVVSKRATVRYRLDPDLPPVEADATQMRQVAMNLITNASDALGGLEGMIVVKTGVMEADAGYLRSALLDEALPAGRYAYVEVSDTGAGMDPATQARIFDPFFTTKQTGRGLGLAAVLGIVRSHRGAVKIYSEPGQGSTFKVLVPVSADGALPASVPVTTPAAAPVGGPQPRPLVLLVDDEETVRATTGAMLEEAGYAVVTAADGIEAVEVFRARAGEVAAVVLDMTMPRLSGEETFRELRRISPDVPVILSSGFNEQDAVNRFTGKGIAGFIQKPYRMQAISDKIRAALAARPARG